MKATISRLLAVVVTVGAVAAVAPPANATGERIIGGCDYDTVSNADLTGDTWVGVIDDRSVTTHGPNVDIGAVVTCKIQVNGVDAPGTTFSYTGYGVQAGADPVSFTATDTDEVRECQRVVYQDGADTGWSCPLPINLVIPPGEFPQVITMALEAINGVAVYDVDPNLCPVLAAHPGTYGPVTISADGDVDAPDPLDLLDGPLWDCPPYGNF